MRKNAPRKWIHAILDVLPLLVIPIFAININQKSVEPISIEVQEQVRVDFNQQMNFENSTYYSSSMQNYNVVFENITLNSYTFIDNVEINQNHIYYLKSYLSNDLTGRLYSYRNNGTSSQLITYAPNTYYEYRGKIGEIGAEYLSVRVLPTTEGNTFNGYFALNIFDLTIMYGEGKEPTIEEFTNTFGNAYYQYTESQKMLVDKPNPTTYDDTDIGSQFLYSLYKPVNDYFNFNNLFNMNDVWQWIQLNLFQGSAPLPVFMVWNIILYEFFIDLIFLLYSVFMFVIDFAECMIDSFMGKARKGV